MTFSPIISAAGADPDSAATDPAGAAVAPAAAVPDPAVAADSGNGPGQPATGTGHAGAASGQASAAGNAAQDAYPTGQAAAEQGGYPYSASQGAYSAEQAGRGAYSAGQGAYSADAAGSATDSAQQDEAGAAWPHQTFLELGALATAAPCARLHTTLVLWEWELGTLVHTAGLVVSELVSNAVQASAGLTGSRFAGHWAPGTPPVRVWLSADDHRVVIQVWDGSDRPPMPQAVEPEADSGRGLLLVGALSEEWGCYTPEKSSGKVVWAVVTA
ncbi:MAG TPA: ATP-binding protein [Streptosporangiaceae bacterium]|nr:ATP-binding protein [Streptosporangiaceae bacterium]